MKHTKELISCCVDEKKLKRDGIQYLEQIKDLVAQVLALLDGIQIQIQSKLKVNIRDIESISMPQQEGEEQQQEENLDINTKYKLLWLC